MPPSTPGGSFSRPSFGSGSSQIIAAGSLIRDLTDQLEADAAVSPRGVILADRLVRDGDSPMFWPCDESVESAVKQALSALHPG